MSGSEIDRRDGSGRADVAAFLDQARRVAPPQAGTGGRLVFALDATLSRQPTWDLACTLQGEMFDAARRAGGLEVQLVYFRGLGEARASPWVRDAGALGRAMSGIACRGGLTQIGRVLDHVGRAAARAPVAALAYVGDAMEEEIDVLAAGAGPLALRGVRAFMFLEGADPAARRGFGEIARITGGALLPFDRGAADELRALLGAVATYAAGGRAALEAARTGAARRLLADLRP
ncbi:VWA domain-containing protein [Amaricoccus sp.]|uniref:VWA domain-containing protein n=1 Tax=Amaricoccus sp. TaxID=1872485 RepID=UPI001B5C2000|nr:VWA domain-containing protein [Amaricoccus sp.]MBP7001139.1 VWA domain-containing protein [Amaricoccus sp.]